MIINFKKIPIFWYGGIKPNRKKNLLNTFKRLNISATFVQPYISDSIRIGCSLSHLKVLQIIKDYDEPVMVVEDDIKESEWYNEEIEIPDDTDAFYSGTCLNGIHKNWKNMGPDGGCCGNPIVLENYKNYYRIHGMLTTHSIIYVSKLYKKNCYDLLQENNGNRYLDVLFASEMYKYKIYAPKYPLFYQNCEYDNYDAYIKTKTPLIKLLK